ncbi:nucleotide-diphospho-sugar transferase [Hymenopellis radicata]|nr:nucleotide-diphospho-sugar transferase [Hymenopellis radicata]
MHGDFSVDEETPMGQADARLPPFTAVILYLVSQSRVVEMLDSLASLHANLPGHPWPVVLFHTGDFDDVEAQQTLVRQVDEYLGADAESMRFAARLEFVKLEWALPEGIPDNVTQVDPVEAFRWPGYHHMCAFFAVHVFTHPRLQDVTYYMRMDTDSLIEEPLCYDPFELMHRNRKVYGYRSVGGDAFEVTRGLPEYVADYASRHSPVADRLRHNDWDGAYVDEDGEMVVPRTLGYFNSFEIVALQAFRRPDVQEFFSRLDERDAPIRYATVQMFFDDERDTEEFCGMKYYHPQVPTPHCPCVPLS